MTTVRISGSSVRGCPVTAAPHVAGSHSTVSPVSLRLGRPVNLPEVLWFLNDDTIESRIEKKPKRKSVWFLEPARIAAAERVFRESRELLWDPDRVIQLVAAGKSIRLPLRSDLGVISSLFDAMHRGDLSQPPLKPDFEVVHRVLSFCRNETALLTHRFRSSDRRRWPTIRGCRAPVPYPGAHVGARPLGA